MSVGSHGRFTGVQKIIWLLTMAFTAVGTALFTLYSLYRVVALGEWRTLVDLPFFVGIAFAALVSLDTEISGATPGSHLGCYRFKRATVVPGTRRRSVWAISLLILAVGLFMLPVRPRPGLETLSPDQQRDGYAMAAAIIAVALLFLGRAFGRNDLILTPDTLFVQRGLSVTAIPWTDIVEVRDDRTGYLPAGTLQLQVAPGANVVRRYRILFDLALACRPGPDGLHVDAAEHVVYLERRYGARIIDFYVSAASARQFLGTRASLRDIAAEDLRTADAPQDVPHWRLPPR